MSAADRERVARSAEEANERAESANEWTEERMAQCSTRRFHSHSSQRVALSDIDSTISTRHRNHS